MRKLQIQVLTSDGRKSTYETDRFRNVADLKKSIGRTMNVPMAFSKLSYKGCLLANDSILEDAGVKRMSTLELYWQPLVLTPKLYREKELELDKQDQKQRHVSRIVDTYDQEVKKDGDEWTSNGVDQLTIDQVKVKHSPSIDDPQQKQDKEQKEKGQGSTSSDELDFLTAYWRFPKTDNKKSNNAVDYEPNIKKDIKANAKNLDIICELQSSVSCAKYPCNTLKNDNDNLLEELLEQCCLGCKNPLFRSGVRLTAGRMSNSIINNIRKNQNKCKK